MKTTFSYGITSFLNVKNIQNKKDVVRKFTSETRLDPDKNFHRFAQWIDTKLKTGEIKGQRVSALSEGTIIHIQKEKEFSSMARTIPQEYYDVWNILKNNKRISKKGNVQSDLSILNLFSKENNIPNFTITIDNAPKAVVYQEWIKYVIENDLIEPLKQFCK